MDKKNNAVKSCVKVWNAMTVSSDCIILQKFIFQYYTLHSYLYAPNLQLQTLLYHHKDQIYKNADLIHHYIPLMYQCTQLIKRYTHLFKYMLPTYLACTQLLSYTFNFPLYAPLTLLSGALYTHLTFNIILNRKLLFVQKKVF